MIHVLADIVVLPGRREDVLAAFRQLVPQVLAEDGCIAYGPTVDVATGHPAQPPVRADAIVVVEQWASVDALRAHLRAPHMEAFRAKYGALIADLTLRVTVPA